MSKISYKNILVLFTFIALTAASLFVSVTTLAGAFNGAVYDTDQSSLPVNQNIFASKADVYLNGGPQNDNARGLPAGVYYFQVTDPNGETLLSTTPAVCRQVQVKLDSNGKGRIMGVWDDRDEEHPQCEGFHPNGAANPNNGSVAVQLFPFNDTPNEGGVYKVWLIKKEEAVIQNDGLHLEFSNDDAKTDNFKVAEIGPDPTDPVLLTVGGLKFFDINGDGIRNGADFPLAGFRIRTTFDPAHPGFPNDVIVPTANDGTWLIGSIPINTHYLVREDVPQACDGFNQPLGGYSWVQTAPPTITVTAPFTPSTVRGYQGVVTFNVSELDFGNRCEKPGDGRTLGFWSNKNGQALIDAADLQALRDLNLRNASGTEFNPTTTTELRNWLLNGTATNMAYMLSVQMAATALNVGNGFTEGATQVVVNGEVGTINAWINEANSSLASHPNTTSPHAERANQERLKNIFDSVNNKNFVYVNQNCRACY